MQDRNYAQLAPCQYDIDRNDFQAIFTNNLEELGVDIYGMTASDSPFANHRGGISTPVFETWPYWWGDDDTEEHCLEKDKPNFIYWGTGDDDPNAGLAIQWYKYALRGARANRQLTSEGLDEVFSACMSYLNGGNDTGDGVYSVLRESPLETRIQVGGDAGRWGIAKKEEVVYYVDFEENYSESTMRWFAYIPYKSEDRMFRDGMDVAGYETRGEALDRIVHYWTEGRGSYDPL
jgi:hypothetical protein